MIEYAAFGWATLTWWTWPLVFVTVMLAVGVVVLGDRLLDRRTEARHTAGHKGKYPCLRHLDSERGQWETYCGDLDGHDGPHGRMILVAHSPVIWPAPE